MIVPCPVWGAREKNKLLRAGGGAELQHHAVPLAPAQRQLRWSAPAPTVFSKPECVESHQNFFFGPKPPFQTHILPPDPRLLLNWKAPFHDCMLLTRSKLFSVSLIGSSGAGLLCLHNDHARDLCTRLLRIPRPSFPDINAVMAGRRTPTRAPETRTCSHVLMHARTHARGRSSPLRTTHKHRTKHKLRTTHTSF
jgi:hypothetical protein